MFIPLKIQHNPPARTFSDFDEIEAKNQLVRYTLQEESCIALRFEAELSVAFLPAPVCYLLKQRQCSRQSNYGLPIRVECVVGVPDVVPLRKV